MRDSPRTEAFLLRAARNVEEVGEEASASNGASVHEELFLLLQTTKQALFGYEMTMKVQRPRERRQRLEEQI